MGDQPWPPDTTSASMSRYIYENNLSINIFFYSFWWSNTNSPTFPSLCFSLQKYADNEELHAEWESAKMANKQRLAQYIMRVTNVSIDPSTLFDIQVKRIHEYKRQLLNILGTVYRYKKIKVLLTTVLLGFLKQESACFSHNELGLNVTSTF